ncbi:MAG TPA: hypothetical protein VIV40_16665 [Kofleriaceae bacterium]
MKLAYCSALAVVVTAHVAAAEPRTSVTWSPVHLVMPLVELQADYNVVPNMGVGVILGGGRVSDDTNMITATAYEVGGQYNYYFMHPFSGLHAGFEGLYLHLGDIEQDSTVSGAGLSVGPYVGYKLETDIGFTFIAQGGVAVLAVKAESSTQMQSDKTVYPLLNLNVGWSF